MPKVQLPSGQIVSVPDELEGQAALDYLDEQERKLTPPGGMTRAAAGVYQGLAGYGEKAANVLERMGLPGQAATAQEFSSAMLDAPDVWQSKQHAPGIGGALAEMGGQLFADLPMIMGAMGAARVPLGAAETLTGRTILPRAGQTFMQQWPRVIGEAAVGGGMLEGATARPNVESAYAKGVEGAGEWALGAAILHPAFKTLGWAASKILGRLRGKPNMTPEMAASDPNLPMVLDRLQKGEKEADIIIDLTQRQGVWEAPPGGPSPPPPQVAGTQRRLPAPTADEYARAVTGELYREGPGGQGEMILETRLGRRKPAEEVPDVSLPYDAASAGVQGELPLSTRIRRRKGQAELPLQMRTTLPETRAGEEPSVIYSQKERRFTDKAQGVLPMEMGTGRIPGTIERGTLPETPPTESPLAPRPMTVEEMDKVPTQQLGLDFTGVTKMQVPKVLPSEMPFKVGQKVRYQGKTRKITGVKGKEFILDDMIAVPAADLKSVGGRRAKPTALESPILPEGEVTKPQGPFEKAPPPSGGEPINLRKVKVEVVEAPKKLVDDLRSVGYSDEFIATLVADHGIEGATTLYKARIAAISQKMKERDAQIRKALGQQVREGVPEEKLRSGEGAELDKSIKDDLINLADAIDDVETKAVAEGRPLTPQEEEEIVSAAVRTGIVPVQKAATNVTPKTRTAADLLRERLTLLKERGLAESEPVTITKTGQIRSKPRPKQSDEELLRLIEESEQDMRGELDHTDGIRKKYDEGDWDSLLKAVPFLLALPASAIASMLAPPEAHAMYGGLMAKAVPKGTRWFSSLVDMLPRFEFSDPVSWKPGAWEGMKQSGFFSADTQFDYKLSDLVNWPEGFLHYPDLDKIKVKKRGGFLDIFQTQKGAFFEESETLVISPFLDEAQALATLKHELQHYIQFVEGFTRGGSPKFIDWREAYEPLLKYYEDTEQLGKLQMLRERGPAVLEEVEKLFEMRYALSKQAEAFDASLGLAQKEAEKFKALNRELVKIREEFDSVYLNYNKLVELYGKGFTTNPEYKMIEAARKRVNKAADEAFTTYLEAVRRANSYRDRIRLLNIPGANSFIEKQKPLDDFAYDAYKLLGGEAEARDTVLRTLLTKAERESIMPMHMALAKGEELPRAEHLVKTMGLPGKPAGPYEKPVPQRDYLKALSAIVLGTGALALASDAEARTVFHGTHTGAIRRFLDKFIGSGEGSQAYGWGHYFTEDIPQIREKEKGNAAVGLLATVLGLAGTAALGSYAYYKLRDFMEAQGRKADELKGMLQKGELNMPEVATAGLSGAGLSALKESIMRALEKTSMFQRSTNQTLEGGQRVTWAEQKAKINPLSEWFVDPSRMAERLGKDVSNWWADLMKADNITSYNFKNHATLFRDVEKTLTKEEQLRMRDILEGTKKPQTQAEEAAYGKLRSFYDEMWNKVVESRQKVYEQNLSEEEYGAFVKVFKEGASEEQVLKGMPREQAEVMKEIFKDYRDLQTKGKIEEYVTKHELGQYHLIEEIVGEDGKVSRRIVANAVSRKDALRKAKKYFEENPDKRSLVIDSNGMLYDLATALPRGSYYRVIRDLGKALKEDITWIEKELGKAVGNKSDIARRAVRRAFTLRPSEKFSPYLQERKDILKGEENIFDVLPAYAMSIEKKTNLDPLINEARRLLQGIDDPMGRQWLSNLIEDTKGRYWMSDRIVDTLLRNLNVEASPLAFSRGIAKIKQGEAMMKFAYRPVAAFINRLSGEGHTWVKFGTESFLDAKRFIKTPEGREFLKLVDPYMGVSYATDASGRIKPKESLWHPLGMFQAAEMPNRETTLAAAYLHALKNLGLNKAEAQEYAIRQNWFTQFTYNAASLPRILRTPVGRLLGQFKPYMLKEVEFIRQLGGQELVRYMAFQLAMGGPRGLLMLLKSLPLLGAWAALDDAEMWLNKHAARTSRGIGGALGVDVTAAATMQLPSRVEDWAGPFLSDLLRINKEVIQPMMRGEGGVARGAWKSLEGSIPIIRYWPELVIDRLMTKGQKDYIIKDDRGRELYRLQWPDYLKEAAGAEPLESSRIRVAEAILNRRQAATNKKKGQVIDTYVKALEGGQPVPPELIAEMQLLGVTPGSVRREARLRGLTPMQRRMLRTELGRRAMLQLEYPIEGE